MIVRRGEISGRAGPVAQHGRLAARDGDDLDLGQAGRAQQGGHLVGAGAQVRRGRRVRRHRRDPHQPV